MPARIDSFIAIALLIALSLVFQVQLKILANVVAPILARTDLELTTKLATTASELISLRFATIIAIAFSLFVLWFFTLTKLDLSVALPLASLALVLNSVGGGLLLGEAVTLPRAGGIAAVAIGVYLIIKS